MDEAEVTRLLLIPFLVAVVAANVAAGYLVRDYRRRNGESSLWRAFTAVCVVSVAAVDVLVPATALALLRLPRLPLTGPAVVLVLTVVCLTISYYGYRVWRVRRERARTPVMHGPIDSPDVTVPAEEA